MRTSLLWSLISLTIVGGCEMKPDIDAPKDSATSISPTAPAIEARPAEVGVGLKGQSLKNETGIGKAIAQPAIVLFQTKEKIAFEIQIPQALSLYKASEGHGPESHEEFMEKIIRFNQIKLPKLPDGQEYRYRPEEEQLWVQPIESK
jgi:hypothetical protein